jgi:Domain of unknown function (DUF4440)
VTLRGSLESSRMKRCGTCNRTYTDPNLSYCVEDGTPLTTEVAEDVPYRPPEYVAPGTSPGTTPGKRRMWPWVVGVFGAFLLGVIGLMIAAAIFVPRMMRQRQAQRPAVVDTNVNANVNANVNTGVAKTTENTSNTPAPSVDTPAPANEEQVLAQLTEIENEWTVANLNADKQKLSRILADDYVGPAAEGGLQGKKEYIDTIERDTTIERWEFDDLKVKLSGDRATLTGKITYFARDQEAVFDFTDKFVWRDARWQATGSEVKRRE